jgi:hypothetical protein
MTDIAVMTRVEVSEKRIVRGHPIELTRT